MILLLFRYLITSAARAIVKIILAEDLNVFALLSEVSVTGSPQWLINLQNIKRYDCSDISKTSFTRAAMVEAQVKRQM